MEVEAQEHRLGKCRPAPWGSSPIRFYTKDKPGGILHLETDMDLQIFNTPDDFEIRTLTISGEPWFIARDICFALGLGNVSQAVTKLDGYEKHTLGVGVISNDTPLIAVSESGLYTLVLGSRKQEAVEFRRWVTREVLPAIRKTGSYTAAPAFQVPKTLSEALRLAADLSDKVESQALQIEAQKPAVEFVEKFVEAKQTQNLRDVAKVLKIKQNDFVDLLLSKGILFRSRGKLSPKAEHMDAGRFEVKEIVTRDGFATVQMRFTTAGVEWIARKVSEWNQKAVVA